MTKAEIRKRFFELRDKCRSPKFETINNMTFSKNDEYGELYKLLEDTGNLDVNYADHLKGRDAHKMGEKADTLTFKECCTVLTFLLRAERFSEGAFTGELADGTVYKLLKRAAEVM